MAPSDKRKRDEDFPLSREDSTKPLIKSSLLENSEETSFPRGGASVLTPLELKQVANEAASDVLFGSKSAVETTGEKTQKKRKINKSKKPGVIPETEESAFDGLIDHVNFKKLKIGTLLLGQITEINRKDLTVSFTDGISGYVSMANISEQFTKNLESLDEEMNEESNDKEYDSSDDEGTVNKIVASGDLPDLKKYFKIGQWLRCSVTINTALESDSGKRPKKRIELSIEPSIVNEFTEEDLNKFSVVQCSIKSIEDHGATLDLGIDGFTGFISKKDCPDFENLLPGSVFLGNVQKRSDRTVAINLDFSSRANKISNIAAVEALVPGQIVDFLCEDMDEKGIAGKVLGMVSGLLGVNNIRCFRKEELQSKYMVGTNIRSRIIACLTNKEGDRILLLSILPHIMTLEPKLLEIEALDAFPIGYTLDTCTVAGRDSEYLYLKLDEDRLGQVHSSRIGDIEATTAINARVLGYNNVDHLYELSTDPKTLALKYLRTKDIPLGELVTCEIVTVTSEGINLKIFGGQFTAFVPSSHISDTRLVYPERKFKIGSKVKGRILNVNGHGHIFVTLKKSLVNADDEIKIITSYAVAQQILDENTRTFAVVQRFQQRGCVLSFFGGIRGFLPTSEISEVFVKRPEDHLRLGQTIVIKLLQVDADRSRIIATCKVSNDEAKQQKEEIEKMVLGRSIVDVTVIEKTKDSLVVEMNKVGLRGVVYVGHLSDSRIEQNRAQLKKIKIGAELRGLVIDKDLRTQVFNLTLKASLMKDAENDVLPIDYDAIKAMGKTSPMHGYVKSFSDKGIFVAFNGKFVGLVLPSYAVESRDIDISKTFYLNQSVTAYLLRTDDEHQRFLLSFKKSSEKSSKTSSEDSLVNPVDSSIKTIKDLSVGKIISARIKGVKKNQLNVILADNLHGRVDISEVFDRFEDIKDLKHPLANFASGDIIRVKIIGTHDTKGHKFLPVTHLVNKSTVFELTMKPSKLDSSKGEIQAADNSMVGSVVVGFVNNFTNNSLWLTISPTLKANISILDLFDDNSTYTKNVEQEFPIGSALKVTVTKVNPEHGTLTVSRRSHIVESIDDVKVGDKIPAQIIKVTERYVLLSLGNNVAAISFATDALDDYSVPLEVAFKGMLKQTIPSEVISVDKENKKIRLLLRSPNAKTPLLTSHKDLEQGQVVQAIVKSVTDKGLFVYLSSFLEAFVPVSKLSDSYLKEWKKFYSPSKPVIGKVVNNHDDSHILLTLRESEVNGDLQLLKGYDEIKAGDVFDGNVKNVTDFGVFVKLDNTLNVTGLAHRTEIADETPEDLQSLFGIGDRVKAFVLKVNPAKKQLSLSLKASHFSQEESIAHETETKRESQRTKTDEDGDEVMDDVNFQNDDSESENELESEESTAMSGGLANGLSLSAGFDWTASILDQVRGDEESEDDMEDLEDFTKSRKSKRRRNKQQITEDKTIDVNTRAPESVGDFERLIMGNPNSSVVWMNYIAFQLQLSEIEKAREIAERALKTINYREEEEKLNIWIAMLNLENTFGTEETLEDVFKRACQYMDSFTIHNKLLSIYQISEKYDEEAELFKVTAKKFGAEKVSIWASWGEFLLSQNKNEEARSVLTRALTILPKRLHIDVVKKFAQLEFSKGNPERGRSLFEGLIADAPKRIDLWNIYLDQEIKLKEKKKVENIFERVFSKKLTRKQAKFFFSKWLQFEEDQDDSKAAEYVKAKAVEYAETHSQGSKD